ncbi:SymE family type I addiction module toxin, partial [Salmonella enterica]|uniref:SymE family type I addiction module toxin n=1 Tax=Salmonella enterica TaxID=28901 RepID=UPI000A4F219B
PSLHLKGDWLTEEGFDTGASVTVKLSEGCLILIAETDEVRDLRKELYQVKKSMKHIKAEVNNSLIFTFDAADDKHCVENAGMGMVENKK